jgi:hypothetical protein
MVQALLASALEKFFEPSLESPRLLLLHWSTEDEIYWKETIGIWMKAVREFERLEAWSRRVKTQATSTRCTAWACCENWNCIRRAGFQPLEVVRHATHNGAKALGKSFEIVACVQVGSRT